MPHAFSLALVLAICFATFAQDAPAQDKPAFRVLVLTETGGVHGPYVQACTAWLNNLAAEKHFAVDYVNDTKKIDDAFLAQYQLFFQMNYPPYAWTDTAKSAFEKAINTGSIGWVGVHHATLLGDFDGYPLWPWFSDFMGGIRFKSYIPNFAAGQVNVEDKQHPVMKGVPASFTIKQEEWYTYDKSPRANVRVLASVDESTYEPARDVKMGDHPVIWTNEHLKARNCYVFMGHSDGLLDDDHYKLILKNALLWAAGREE